jgi:hypothetical protein
MARRLQDKVNRRAAKAVGPAWVGQVVAIEVEDDGGNQYNVQWLPDRNNDLLHEAGKPMHFYYLPDKPRLDRDEDGHFVFHLQEFSGVMDPTKNIGEPGFSEEAGGAMTFTATLGMPKDVLDRAFKALQDQLPTMSNVPFFFRRRNDPPPLLGGPVALHANKTVLHSLAFAGADAGAGLQPWTFEIQGAGAGTLNVLGSNAFTAMLGSRPVQMLKASAESGASQVTLENHISYEIWTLVTRIDIEGEWESVYNHFSGNIKGGWWFTAGEFERQVDNLVQDGVVTVRVDFGAGMVDAAQQQNYEKAADAIASQLMTQILAKLDVAQKRATEEPIEATVREDKWYDPTKIWGSPRFGAAFKSRKDTFKGSFRFSKEINKQILKSDTLSSQMEGLFDELGADESARGRYFSQVFFEEGFKKIHVVATGNANWGGEGDDQGDPIHRMKLQIGYPDSQGNMIWKSAGRFKNNDAEPDFSADADLISWTKDTRDRMYVVDFTRHDAGDDADQIHLKRTISFAESPDVATNEITEEEVTNAHAVEVRGETAGKLSVGPIRLDMPIGPEDKQVSVLVRVSTSRFGETVYEFNSENVDEPRFYDVWYAAPDDVEPYTVKSEVVIKGRRFGQKALRWESEAVQLEGSGPLMVELPPVPADLEEQVDEYLGVAE